MPSALLELIEIVKNPDAMAYIHQHSEVQHLFKNRELLNMHDDAGHAPLHYAVMHGSLDMVQYLIKCGADINILNNKKETPFILMIDSFSDGAFEELIPRIDLFLHKGADVALEDQDGNTPMGHIFGILEDAILEIIESQGLNELGLWFSTINFDPIISLALKTPRSVLDKPRKEYEGKSLAFKWDKLLCDLMNKKELLDYEALQTIVVQLHVSLMPVDVSQVKELISKGDLFKLKRFFRDNPRHQFDADADGNDLLMLAVISGHFEIVRFLVDQGFKLTAFNKQGQSALMLSIMLKRTKMLKYFLNIATMQDLTAFQTPGKTALSAAADSRNQIYWGMVIRALEKQIQGNQLFVLIVAGTPNNLDKYLRRLSPGYITNAAGFWSQAQYNEATQQFKLLQQASHQEVRLVDERDSEGKTALHHLVAFYFYCLIRRQLPFPCSDLGQAYFLNQAYQDMLCRYDKMMEILMKHNVDLQARDYQGNTVLMASASTPYQEMTADLLNKRGLISMIDAVNSNDETALMMAVREGHLGTVCLLIESGANPNIKNKEGKTAFDLTNDGIMLSLLESDQNKTYHARDVDETSPPKRLKR